MAGDRLLLLAFFLSGAAALGYELLWTRLLGLSLGSETLGVLATLAGFFGGMAVGAWALHRRAHAAADPVRLFVTLELVAAGFAVASPHLLHALAGSLPGLLGGAALWLRITVAVLVLLPGTACLGATLAALAEARRRSHPDDLDGRGLGRLYAANTAGATLGVLATIYLVLPALGYAVGALVPAALGVGAALLARQWARGRTSASVSSDMSPRAPGIDTSRDPDPDVLAESWLLYLLAFGGGLAGIGLEVVGTQVLAQNLENTVYTFADILAVMLVGTALGAAIYQRFVRRLIAGRPATVDPRPARRPRRPRHPRRVRPARQRPVCSPRWPPNTRPSRSAVRAELAVAALVFLAPTIAMGALFAHITGLLAAGGRGVGRAYAVNTLGCALAPFLFGLGAVPSLGYADALYLSSTSTSPCSALFGWYRRFHPAALVGVVVALVALTAAAPRSLALVEPRRPAGPPSSARPCTASSSSARTPDQPRSPPAPRRSRPGRCAACRSAATSSMGGAFSFGEHRMGHLCALLAEASAEDLSKRPCSSALGTGATMGAAMQLSDAEADGVELVPQVLAVLPQFAAINHELFKSAAGQPARRRRAALRRSPPTPPTTSSSPTCSTPARTAPARSTPPSTSRRARSPAPRRPVLPVAAALPARPRRAAHRRPHLPRRVPRGPRVPRPLQHRARPRSRSSAASRPPTPAALRLDSARLEPLARPRRHPRPVPRDLLASYMADGTALQGWAGDGPHNTDLHPRVLFDAPAAAYADDPELGARNLASRARPAPRRPDRPARRRPPTPARRRRAATPPPPPSTCAPSWPAATITDLERPTRPRPPSCSSRPTRPTRASSPPAAQPLRDRRQEPDARRADPPAHAGPHARRAPRPRGLAAPPPGDRRPAPASRPHCSRPRPASPTRPTPRAPPRTASRTARSRRPRRRHKPEDTLRYWPKNHGVATAERHCQLKLRMCGTLPNAASPAMMSSAVIASSGSAPPSWW
jgi:spermidine synthase